MRAASCFSGIGAAELALPEAEWLWSAEVDPFANAVRAQRLNDHNLGDALAHDFIERAECFGPLDLLIGGPPCQDFSIAGLRAGLDGDRGNLSLRWVQIINALRPRYAVTENVPGWLSVNRGHAFGAFIAGLVGHDTALLPPKECGGRWTDAGMVDGPDGRLCWRTLDAQFFGLAQRRRRVFVVFCPRDGGDPAQVLLERKGVQGNPPPSREAGQRVAPTLEACANRTGGDRPPGTSVDTADSLIADGFDASEDGTGRGTPLVAFDARQSDTITYGDMSGPLDTDGHSVAVAWSIMPQNSGMDYKAREVDVAQPVMGNGPGGNQGGDYIQSASSVRRLTPREAERLQGFPDDFTNVAYRGKPAADGNRYRVLGNAFAIPVVRWIARRIVREDALALAPAEVAA